MRTFLRINISIYPPLKGERLPLSFAKALFSITTHTNSLCCFPWEWHRRQQREAPCLLEQTENCIIYTTPLRWWWYGAHHTYGIGTGFFKGAPSLVWWDTTHGESIVGYNCNHHVIQGGPYGGGWSLLKKLYLLMLLLCAVVCIRWSYHDMMWLCFCARKQHT